MSFFRNFPFTQLDIGGEAKAITDIFRHVDVNDILADGLTNYKTITVNDGERPDNLSQRLYGTPDYYWTFFIVNEKLKKGLEDWPKATSSIEAEFVKDYDKIGCFTLKPIIRDKIVVATGQMEEDQDPATKSYDHISNTLSGLDLSYEDLRLYRNFSTAKIHKWDSNLNQLYVSDFSNRNLFMGDPVYDIAGTLRNTRFLGADQTSLTTWASSGDNFANLQGNISFTFNDWPIIGQSGENGYREGDKINHQGFGPFYKKTMTGERVEWCIELFKWFDRNIIESAEQTETSDGILSFNNLPYREFLDQSSEDSIGITQAALNVFSSYFTPWYVNGNMKWYGLQPYRRPADDREHSFNTSRNAPCYYYKNGGQPFVQDDIINGHDMLFGIGKQQVKDANNEYSTLTYGSEVAVEGQDPMNYVSHYQRAIKINDDKSQIKVIRPDVIQDFVQEFRLKLNAGVTRIGSTPGVVSTTGSGAGGTGNGTSSSSSSSIGGGGGGGTPATGGGGSGY
tara:strand:- start:351 stop:1877 length:1527 start_codon:yes stop_codon:yes gene_type:complete